jgi:hypothetical protein
MKKIVEIEYRVKIEVSEFQKVFTFLKENYRLASHTQRLSFMSFFKQNDKQFDIRVRITNKESEVVFKIGSLHSDDRTEMSQNISNDQIIGFSRMYSHLTDQNYIAERETFNFESNDHHTVISLVRSENLAYIEYEFQDEDTDEEAAKKVLMDTIERHGFTVLDEAGFDDLNKKLDEEDWRFSDSTEDVQKLQLLLESKYF